MASAAFTTHRIKAPSAFLALTELPRAIAEWRALPLAAPLLESAPHGDGHPVLVLPGFVAGDGSTAELRRFLTSLGYDAHAWELGRNFGPRAIGPEGEKLFARLEAIHAATGRKVSLVGWSLGGIMARLLARRATDAVRQLITLGSPFAGNPRETNVWRAYEFLTGHRVDDSQTRAQLAEIAAAPPVPTTAIYTREDGVVAWQNCMERPSPATENIEVRGSHCGMVVNPAVLLAVADRLAQPENDWQPFQRTGVKAKLYPVRGNA